MQRLWWRAHDAQTPEPAATRASITKTLNTGQPYASRRPKPASASLPSALQIPRGERRFRRPRRRRRTKPLFALGGLILATCVAAYALPLDRLHSADLGRELSATANEMMIAAGFGIAQVEITGQHYAADGDIYDALDLPNVKTFAALDSKAALQRIERIPWIDKAQITRVYPGTLDIVVTERTPAFIWTRGNENYLVDVTGRVLGPAIAVNDWHLMRVAGEGAQKEATLMLTALRQFPAIERDYAFGERIAERRWRIVLKNGSALDLGADREIEGLEEIAEAPAVVRAMKVAATIIDVRTPGRIAMRPADGKAARTAALETPLVASRR